MVFFSIALLCSSTLHLCHSATLVARANYNNIFTSPLRLPYAADLRANCTWRNYVRYLILMYVGTMIMSIPIDRIV